MRIIFLFTIVFFILEGINAQEDWELQKDKEGIKVWTKDYPDSKFKQFKATALINSSLENVVAVFLDIENMGAWYDRIEKVTLVEKVSDLEGTYVIDFELPWPVADRISAVRSVMHYDPQNNVVTVKTKYEDGIIKNSDGLVVTDMHSEWILTQVDDGVDIFHKGYMHPAGTLPAWIANSGVKDGPVKTLIGLRGILADYADVDVDFIE